MAYYTVVEVFSDGLIAVRRSKHGDVDSALWSRGKTRKYQTCVITGRQIPIGSMAYRPVGNQFYRYERIDAAAIEPLD